MQCEHITGFHLMKTMTGGSWRWRYTDATGKRKVATIGKYSTYKPHSAAAIALDWLKADADPIADKANRREEAIEAEEEAKRRAIEAEEEAKRRTLRNYLDGRYARHMERWSARSARENRQRLVLHFGNLLDKDMSEITNEDILSWQYKLEKKGRAYSTIRRHYSSLKTLLRQAVKDGVLDADPLDGFSLDAPTLKDQKRLVDDPKKADRRMLTTIEVRQVHNGLELFAEEIRQQRRNSRKHGKPHLPDLDAVAYPHWFIPFCHLALHTGLRPGDLYGLTWEELNIPFARLTKTTEKSKAQIRKGAKPAVVDMRLNPTIKSIMAEWWKQHGSPESGLVFPSPRTGRRLDSHAHVKPWKAVKRLGGLPPTLNFYAFRHHFISALVKAGVPLLAVAKLAGHKSTGMIEAHYGHLCEEQAAEAVDIVAATLHADNEGKRRATD